jgi:hypothetical protein
MAGPTTQIHIVPKFPRTTLSKSFNTANVN